jgi:hypothetical protein
MFSPEGVFYDIVLNPTLGRSLTDLRRKGENSNGIHPAEEFTLCYSRDESPNIGVYCEAGYRSLADIRIRERELTIKDPKITAFNTLGKQGKQKLFTL